MEYNLGDETFKGFAAGIPGMSRPVSRAESLVSLAPSHVSVEGPRYEPSNYELAAMFRSYATDMNNRFDRIENEMSELKTLIGHAGSYAQGAHEGVQKLGTHMTNLESEIRAVANKTPPTVTQTVGQTPFSTLRPPLPPPPPVVPLGGGWILDQARQT